MYITPIAMADEKAAPLPLSAVFVEEEQKKKHAPAADPPTFPGVRHVIVWALLSAGIVAFSIAYALIVRKGLLPRPRPGRKEVTAAEAGVAGALAAGMLLCAVSQAAAGALALVLRRRPRRRLLLAYAALGVTAAGHCMWAGLHIMFMAADGGLTFWTGVTTAVIFFSGVGDVICFGGLILGGGAEE